MRGRRGAGRQRHWLTGMLIIAAMVVLLPLAAAAAQPAGGPGTQIVGGRQTKPGKFPFMTFVQIDSGAGLLACGGSLIAKRFVLTAAHCVVDDNGDTRPASAFLVAVGSTDIQQADPRGIRGVTAVTPHPDYDPATFANDAAVLQLDRPVRAFEPLRLVRANQTRYEDAGDPVVVAGWGARRYAGAPVTRLRNVGLSVSADQLCVNRMAVLGLELDPAVSVCATGRGVDSCQGDSGGPLLAKERKRRFIGMGIVSFGGPCALQGYPAAYTRLSNPDINAFVRTTARLGGR